MKVKATHDYILVRESVNPFLKKTTASGLYTGIGFSESQETGDIEALDKRIGFAIVTSTGPTCSCVKEGDGIFYDRLSLRPIPIDNPVWQTSERNIVGYVEKEELHASFAEYEREAEAIERREKAVREEREKQRAENVAETLRKLESGEISSKPRGPVIKIN